MMRGDTVAVREPSTPPVSKSPVIRSRTNGKACTTCHRRKIKCDIAQGGTPCSFCKDRDSECHPYIRHSDSGIRRAPARQKRPQTRSTPSSAHTSAVPTPAAVPPNAAADDDDDDEVEAHHAAQPEDEPETRNLSEFLNRSSAEVYHMTTETRLYFIGSETSTLNYLIRKRTAGNEKEQATVHFASNSHPRRQAAIRSEWLRLPGKKLMGELIDAYFVHVNKGIPIVDEEDFEVMWQQSDPNRPMSIMLLNAILMVGAHCLSPTRPELRKMAPDFFRRARQLFDARYEGHREYYMQTALLLTWYCEHLEDVVSNSWHWIGVAIRTGYGMGIHREIGETKSVPDRMRRLWTRLYWIMFQFDVMISAGHGRPQAMDLDLSDVPELDYSHFGDVSEPEMDFTIQHTRLCKILSRAMRARASLRATPEDRQKATEEASRDLAAFMTSLPYSMQLTLTSPSYWTCLLHLTYNYTLLLLYRPPPRDGERIVSPSDSGICEGAVKQLTMIFDYLREREMLGGLWIPCTYILFATLVHLTGQPRSESPLSAASSKAMFEKLMKTLKALTSKWLFAHSLLQVFQTPSHRQSSHDNVESTDGHPAAGSSETTSNPTPGYQMLPTPESASAPSTGHMPGDMSVWPSMDLSGGMAAPMVFDPTMEGLDFTGFDNSSFATADMSGKPVDLEFLLAGIGSEYGMQPAPEQMVPSHEAMM